MRHRARHWPPPLRDQVTRVQQSSSGIWCPRHQPQLPRAGRRSTCVGHAHRGQGVRPRRTGYAGATGRTWDVCAQQRYRGTKVGVVSDGELDGNDGAPVVVETVQVGAERAVSVIAVVVNRGSTSSTTTATPGLLFVSSSGGASVASDRSRTQVVRYNRRVVADLRCGRTAEMAWSCRKCCWLRSRPHAEYVYWAVSRTRQCLGTGGERWRRFGVGGVR